MSYDEGQTWPIAKVLDPGISGYADLVATPDGTILCLYERGSVSDSHFHTGYLTLARFNLAWLTDGRDTER
jgi:sialidase-1